MKHEQHLLLLKYKTVGIERKTMDYIKRRIIVVAAPAQLRISVIRAAPVISLQGDAT